MSDFYDFNARTSMTSEVVSMRQFKGKYVLIVNTASECGFTPQYRGLEALHRKYKDQGLVVLGFPCNQFGSQEPGTDAQISQFCAAHYDVTFPIMEKVEVNGRNAHPLFKYLRSKTAGLFGSKIKWNFTKFLVDPDGRPIKRWAPVDTPSKIDAYISKRMATRVT